MRSERNVRKTGGESIEDSAASIRAHGLLQNLTVIERRNHKGRSSGNYEVVAGGRRYRSTTACQRKEAGKDLRGALQGRGGLRCPRRVLARIPSAFRRAQPINLSRSAI